MFVERNGTSHRTRNAILTLLVLIGLAFAVECSARGGQSADDCPPGSKDPDCATTRHKP